jgi:Zn-dependent peptidase ImmA (M78 family)
MKRRPDSRAVNAARSLLEDLQVQGPSEIDVELIAAHLGVLTKRAALEHEEGRLVRAANHGVISVNDGAYRSQKWRFVSAHELGHFLRHADVDQFALCTDTDLHTWYQSSGRETEANDFAAELLMPENLFAKECDRDQA